jgi:hypothetical protein
MPCQQCSALLVCRLVLHPLLHCSLNTLQQVPVCFSPVFVASCSASSQVFFLLKESELTPSGANLLDGRYAVFGYVTQGQDNLGIFKVRARGRGPQPSGAGKMGHWLLVVAAQLDFLLAGCWNTRNIDSSCAGLWGPP